MYHIEYNNSKGGADEHDWHEDVVDLYILYKDNKKIFSEKPGWGDYYVVMEINNLEKEISFLKHGAFYDTWHEDLSVGSYELTREDCSSYFEELLNYIYEVRQILDIENYNYSIRLYN